MQTTYPNAETVDAAPTLPRKQRAVRLGLLTGLLTGGAIALIAYALLPPVAEHTSLAQRLAFALRCTLIASWTLVAGILVVATKRFTSEAIDPISGAESRELKVHRRYVQNTLEQLTLFGISSTALATLLEGGGLKVLVVATLVFVLGRLAFWIGYLKDPLLRIPGFNATFYTSVLMMLYATYKIIRLMS
jgi:uncharacterized membrane protein YecN with MAPEG domain